MPSPWTFATGCGGCRLQGNASLLERKEGERERVMENIRSSPLSLHHASELCQYFVHP